MDNLRQDIDESQAVITLDAMPEVSGERAQLVQLMQNIIGNAVKFRKEGVPPRVHVSAEQIGNEWRFGIHDNGIGLQGILQADIRHFSAAPSTIGVQWHRCGACHMQENRGMAWWQIWVESNYGEGASFYFTIPVPGGLL